MPTGKHLFSSYMYTGCHALYLIIFKQLLIRKTESFCWSSSSSLLLSFCVEMRMNVEKGRIRETLESGKLFPFLSVPLAELPLYSSDGKVAEGNLPRRRMCLVLLVIKRNT